MPSARHARVCAHRRACVQCILGMQTIRLRVSSRTVMTEPISVEKYGIGQPARRLEDPHLVQGLGRYSDDVSLPRQVWGVVVRSPHAHARIRTVDARKALAAPGVLAV